MEDVTLRFDYNSLSIENSITTNGLTFRWADDHLIMTTPKRQYTLDAQGTARLLDMLYAHKDAIFDAEAHLDGLAP